MDFSRTSPDLENRMDFGKNRVEVGESRVEENVEENKTEGGEARGLDLSVLDRLSQKAIR